MGIVWAQNKIDMPYDFSRHQGYIIRDGNILWNDDWFAGQFFFDGTFENYPSTFGPYIESKYFADKLDSSSIDSSQTSSYFDWIQGDYFLDNLDIGVKYLKGSSRGFLHGFKKRYAGAYNQYTVGPSAPRPIRYTYLGTYQSKTGNNEIDVSIGNFNSNFGLLDTLDTSFIDSRITSSNLEYRFNLDSLFVTMNAHNFLQRYNSLFSSSTKDGVRYLTRTKLSATINFMRSDSYDIAVGADINVRSLRSEAFRSASWNSLRISIANSSHSLRAGIINLINNNYFIADGIANYNFGKFKFKSSFSHNYFPSHISISEAISSEQKNQLSINTNWTNNKLILGAGIFLNSFKREDEPIPDQYSLPKEGFNIWLSGFLEYELIYDNRFSISYDRMNSNNYITDGIKDRVKLKIENQFKLFSGSMFVKSSVSLSGFLNRYSDYVLHPVEKYPVRINTESITKDTWLADFFISLRVRSLQIKYEINNLSNVIYDYFGESNIDYNIQFNPYYPEMRRLASLSIYWKFLD
tara:strand:- start:324 stop:1889 length:1566 start_codon:yes stop_codon:yes gene_type:complete